MQPYRLPSIDISPLIWSSVACNAVTLCLYKIWSWPDIHINTIYSIHIQSFSTSINYMKVDSECILYRCVPSMRFQSWSDICSLVYMYLYWPCILKRTANFILLDIYLHRYYVQYVSILNLSGWFVSSRLVPYFKPVSIVF